MRGFLQVISLFCLPVAIVIWHDLYTGGGGYLQTFGAEASRYVALGLYVVTAVLCLHTPLRLWRQFDPMSLRLLCLTVALVTFWVAVRLATSGRLGDAPLMNSLAVFLIPIAMYALLSHFLFKWASPEFTDATSGEGTTEQADKIQHTDEHGDP